MFLYNNLCNTPSCQIESKTSKNVLFTMFLPVVVFKVIRNSVKKNSQGTETKELKLRLLQDVKFIFTTYHASLQFSRIESLIIECRGIEKISLKSQTA